MLKILRFVVLQLFFSSKTFTHVSIEGNCISETNIVLLFVYLEIIDVPKFICIAFNMDLLLLFIYIGNIHIHKAYQGDVSFELILFFIFHLILLSCISCIVRL